MDVQSHRYALQRRRAVQNDPLWKLRHALAGVGLALLVSVLIAALLGSALGDLLGGTYGWRAGMYSGLVLYVVIGAGVLFVKVAQHETRPVSAQRVGLWVASLWVWPLLLGLSKPKSAPAAPSASAGPAPRTPEAPAVSTTPPMPPGSEAPGAATSEAATASTASASPSGNDAPKATGAPPPPPPSL